MQCGRNAETLCKKRRHHTGISGSRPAGRLRPGKGVGMPGEQGGYLEQKADEDYDGEGEGEEGEDAYDEGEAGEEVKSLCVRHLGFWGYKDLG